MRPFGVVILSPLLDDDFGLFETIEDFSVDRIEPLSLRHQRNGAGLTDGETFPRELVDQC
jgi:hypothetical protein